MKPFITVLLLSAICLCPGFAQTTDHRKSQLNCVTELTCNSLSLTSPQKERIAELKHDRNLLDCLRGSALCDPGQLNASEAREVIIANQRRNLLNCEQGQMLCDHSL